MQHDNFIKRVVYKALQLIPDSVYVRLKYRKAFGRWPDLRNPRSFNEKLTWLKLHDRNPLYTAMVDKYEAKRYVAGIIGDEYIYRHTACGIGPKTLISMPCLINLF